MGKMWQIWHKRQKMWMILSYEGKFTFPTLTSKIWEMLIWTWGCQSSDWIIILIWLMFYVIGVFLHGLPWWFSGKEPACQWRGCGFDPWVRKVPWRRKWQPIPVFLPGKSYGQRSLTGYSPWDWKRVRHDWAQMHACIQGSHFNQFRFR